ncbi:MAG: Gfo/Idh/MocA family oxidoreductase [Betaproteobacteria bacterium]|nr:Gfo/Idh/MocA family oxidoreductase [Betaproteobacteria bacterium]
MRTIVVGLGTQGYKRRRFAGADFVAEVDPANSEARYRDVSDVPLADYDAALVCVPDATKLALIEYLVGQRKHVLVEKPLVGEDAELERLQGLARSRAVLLYTAYNHRFEPHFVRMRDLIASGALGAIYHCRMFYGNGTARLVRESVWRDEGAGVLPDLGSHLIDTARFWFGDWDGTYRVVSASRFENRAPDHVMLSARGGVPALDFEMTLLSWRNHFTCDVLAEKGTAHIQSLCKWGPSIFIHRQRVLPSGRPPEQAVTLVQDDPTWALEYAWFKAACAEGRQTSLADDLHINRWLRELSAQAIAEGAK